MVSVYCGILMSWRLVRKKGFKRDMSKITEKIKEAAGAVDNLTKFKKFSKLKASYIEYDKFSDSNLHGGYLCYNCIYRIEAGDGKCMLVEDKGLM